MQKSRPPDDQPAQTRKGSLPNAALPSPRHFLAAPKFVRFFVVCVSPSLSSASFFLFLIAALVPPADVGVGWAEPLSRNDVEIGVGACDAGVEPTEPGVPESCVVGISSQTWIANASGRIVTYPVVRSV